MTQNNQASIITRHVQPRDTDYIYSSWLNHNYYSNPYFTHMPQDLYFKEYSKEINKIIKNPLAEITIAVLEEDPNMIIGYAVTTGTDTLNWVYVKKDYRNKGVAKFLLASKHITKATTLTKTGIKILNTHKHIQFNPLGDI